MNPAIRLKTLPLLRSSRNPIEDLESLSDQLLQRVREWMPVEAALVVVEDSPRMICPNGFRKDRQKELENRFAAEPDLLQNRHNFPGRFSPSLFLSDGSEILIFPLIHNGATEGVLCLHDPNEDGQLQLRKGWERFSPVCEDAARIIADRRAYPTGAAPSKNIAVLPLHHISSKLMSNIAHDLRTPVTAVRGYLKMMLNGRVGPISEVQARCLEGAMNGLEQIIGIANTVGEGSDFTERVHLEKLNFQDIWSTAASSVRDCRIEKGIDLQERLNAFHPVVCGDYGMIRDVVEELASRAIALADRETECLVEIFNRKTSDVVLRISFVGTCSESDMEQVVSELHPPMFLHGGRLAFNISAENQRSFILSLPGYDA